MNRPIDLFMSEVTKNIDQNFIGRKYYILATIIQLLTPFIDVM